MNTKLNRSDYYLLIIFFGVSAIINIIDYAFSKNKLAEYLIDIPASIILGMLGVIIFMYHLIPEYLIRNRDYTVFVIMAVMTMIVVGGAEWTLGFISVGADFDKFPSAFNFVFNSIYSSSDSIGFPLGILLTKKFYESQQKRYPKNNRQRNS